MVKTITSFFFVSFLIFIASGFTQPVQAQTATLYFSPATGSFSEGGSFWISIMVNTKAEAVNAVAAYFSYPEDKLEPLGVSTAGSLMTIWAEKEAKEGLVKIAGGLPTPGFSGIQKIASVGFKAKVASGSVNFKFSSDSAVLTDAENKNILNLTLSGQANFSFKPKVAQPPAPIEILAPVISEVKVSNITQTEAFISWKTDKDSDSLIEYGLTANYGFAVSDERLTKEHSLAIFELSPGTLYHFKVKSKVAPGKESQSEDSTFFTLGYQVEIKVLNIFDEKPLVGAKIIFSGTGGEIVKTTDGGGKAIFENLPSGKHWTSVQYQDASLSYLIEVLPKEEIQRFEFKFEPAKQKGLPLTSILLIAIIIIALIISVFKIFKGRSKNLPINPI